MGDKSVSILVIDDDPQIRQLVSTGLSTVYTVHVATDANDATQVLAKIGVPGLIVCDVMMPKVDGITFVQKLRKQKDYERVPVVFLTAKTSAADVVQGINAGARYYMTKPFKMQELLAKIAKILG